MQDRLPTRIVVGLFVASALVVSWIASAPVVRGQSIEQVSIADDGSAANYHCESVSVSDDGMRVAFASAANNLVPGDFNLFTDVFVRDRRTGATTRVNVSSSGAEANSLTLDPCISGDGNVVVFASFASNLVANDLNGDLDVFVHDLTTATTTRASINDADTQAGNDYSYSPAVSKDGRYVVFTSDANNLVAGDTNAYTDVFVRDRIARTTVRVSVATDGTQADSYSGEPAISRDGRHVTFTTLATNLDPADTDGQTDIYRHDVAAGTTTLVSVDSNGVKGDINSTEAKVSDDGRYVAFWSGASNLVAGDDFGTEDVFVRDLVALTTTCASLDSDGNFPIGPSFFASVAPDLSGDGRFVVFTSSEDKLVGGDHNNLADVFARETILGVTTRSVRAEDGGEPDAWSTEPRISIDGAFVAFLSPATNLVAGGGNGFTQAFVMERRLDAASAANYGVGLAGTLGVPTLAASEPPVLHRMIDLQVGNSWGNWTVALFLIGTQRAQLPTTFGADLLVAPTWTLLVPLPPGGGVVSGRIPADEAFVGLPIDVQALELDPGAVDGVSFTAGLELGIGY